MSRKKPKPGKKPPGKKQQRDPSILTPREALFVLKLLELDNVTQAYLDAGYRCTREAASASGGALLRKPRIAAAVDRARAKRLEVAQMSADEAMERLATVARADLRLMFDEKGKLLPVHQWPDALALALKGYELKDDGGIKVTLDSRLTALDLIATDHGRIVRKVDATLHFDHLKFLAGAEKPTS